MLRLKNVWTLWTLWTIDKYAKQLIANMQLRRFFSTFIVFFSDFVHFTLKLFKILYYLCTRNSKSPHAHRTFIALPSHTRTWVAAMSPAGVPKRFARSRSLRLFQLPFGRFRSRRQRINSAELKKKIPSRKRWDFFTKVHKVHKVHTF